MTFQHLDSASPHSANGRGKEGEQASEGEGAAGGEKERERGQHFPSVGTKDKREREMIAASLLSFPL